MVDGFSPLFFVFLGFFKSFRMVFGIALVKIIPANLIFSMILSGFLFFWSFSLFCHFFVFKAFRYYLSRLQRNVNIYIIHIAISLYSRIRKGLSLLPFQFHMNRSWFVIWYFCFMNFFRWMSCFFHFRMHLKIWCSKLKP